MAQLRIQGVCTRSDILLGQMPAHWRRVRTSPLPRSVNRALPAGQWAEVSDGVLTVKRTADDGSEVAIGSGALSGAVRARVWAMDQKQGTYDGTGRKYTGFRWAVTITLSEAGQ